MMSTAPLIRPVSIDSLALSPISPPLSFQKAARNSTTRLPPSEDEPDSTEHIHREDTKPQAVEMAETSPDTKVQRFSYRSRSRAALRFENLPNEIHEAILDHLFGVRASTLSTTAPANSGARCWNKALRHPRRKALSNLALVSPVWRPLIQERIYRHSTHPLFYRFHPYICSLSLISSQSKSRELPMA